MGSIAPASSRAGNATCCPVVFVFPACECCPWSPLNNYLSCHLLFPAFIWVSKQASCLLILQHTPFLSLSQCEPDLLAKLWPSASFGVFVLLFHHSLNEVSGAHMCAARLCWLGRGLSPYLKFHRPSSALHFLFSHWHLTLHHWS